MKTLVYAGSFDPVTLGHLDIIQRAGNLCDNLVVLILKSQNKKYKFTIEQRIAFLQTSTQHIKNLSIDSSSLLLADYMKKKSYTCLLRGIRGVKDMDFEESMFVTNKALSTTLESVFLFSNPQYRHISSSLVKELIPYSVEWKSFVPLCVAEVLKKSSIIK